ncbi:MAG: hypothetical protein ACXIVF_05565 [Rhizobiaceae bacterium]
MALPPSIRHIHMELAREKGHPAGERDDGYDILAPLDTEGKLDPAEWKAHAAACRVRRFRHGETDRIGLLRRKPGGAWYFDYEEGDDDDELGFRFNDERFVPGEYVSLTNQGETHTYRIVSVVKP